jgi:heavy metal translocating P-type ATPase
MTPATTRQASREQTGCHLCGLNLGSCPLTEAFGGEPRQFCCHGCQNVYAILWESGVLRAGQDPRDTDLFRQSLALGLVSQPESNARPPLPVEWERRDLTLAVSNMWCTSCGWLIEHALSKQRGVEQVEALFTADSVRVRYCPQVLPPERIREQIEQLGYRVVEPTQEARQAERRDLILRAGMAGFLWMNVMTFSTVFYVGLFETIAPDVHRYLPFVLWALTTPVVFYSAWPILRSAWLGVRARVLRMESLLALGILAAYVFSIVQAFRSGKHYYFDVACAITTLVLLGKLLERSAKERTRQALASLYQLLPRKARWLDGLRERFIGVEELDPGALVLVKAGERIPVDGDIVDQATQVDESIITGESRPVPKRPGERVVAGSLNAGQPVTVRMTARSADSTIQQMVAAVEKAIHSRSHLETLVDRTSRVFIPLVMLFALATYAGWYFVHGSATAGLMPALAVLVIACPCALGLATPLALTAAIGAASRRGILVHQAQALETLRRVDTVIFDKTGTLTGGRFEVLELHARGDQQQALRLIAAVESKSEHPLGQAIVRYAQQRQVNWPEASGVERREGAGLAGDVGHVRVSIGNARLVTPHPQWAASAQDAAAAGHTVLWFGWDGQCEGMVILGDELRPDAPQLVAALRDRGLDTLLLSGDSRTTTEAAARLTGVNTFHAEVTPQAKIELVQQLQGQGRVVAMLGDGVNDAPALAQADLGIAVANGTALAMEAAPLTLMSPSLLTMLDALDLAARTNRIIRQNLFWAFFYNVAGLSLAATAILNPIIAAAAMIFSSASVVFNSLRLNSPTSRPRT